MISLPALVIALSLAQGPGLLADIPGKYLEAKPSDTRVVATVNGQTLTAGEVQSLLWDWQSRAVTDELVNYLVVKTEAARQSVTVSQKEIEDEIDRQVKTFAGQLPAGANVEDELRKQGYPKSRIYLAAAGLLLTNKLMLRRFDASEFVKVSTIVVKPKSEQASDVAAAIKVAEAAYAKLAAGTPWVQVLKANTTNPEALKVNGLIGWRMTAAFPPSVLAEFKSIKIGGITKPAQTANGIQIFRLEARGQEAKDQELALIKQSYLAANQVAFVNQLRAAARIDRAR